MQNEEQKLLVQKARIALRSACFLVERGDDDGAANRAHFALLHATHAYCLTKSTPDIIAEAERILLRVMPATDNSSKKV